VRCTLPRPFPEVARGSPATVECSPLREILPARRRGAAFCGPRGAAVLPARPLHPPRRRQWSRGARGLLGGARGTQALQPTRLPPRPASRVGPRLPSELALVCPVCLLWRNRAAEDFRSAVADSLLVMVMAFIAAVRIAWPHKKHASRRIFPKAARLLGRLVCLWCLFGLWFLPPAAAAFHSELVELR